jgi:hypothetical protein
LELIAIVNKTFLVANFAAKHGLLTSSKFFTKPTTISFCTLIDLKAWMSVIFGNRYAQLVTNFPHNNTHIQPLKKPLNMQFSILHQNLNIKGLKKNITQNLDGFF